MGIGGLPEPDAKVAAQTALQFHPVLPTLPQRNVCCEGIVSQAMVGYQESGDPGCAVELPSEGFESLAAFVAACDASAHRGPVKLQLCGPITLATALLGVGLKPADAVSHAVALCSLRANAMLDLVDESLATPAVFVFDEPSMTLIERGRLPFETSVAIDALSAVLASVEERSMTGIHCCAAGWSWALEAGPDLLSIPCTSIATGSLAMLARFVESGGWVAWGVVPSRGPVGESPAPFWRRLVNVWNEVISGGADAISIRTQALVTPTCGLSLHEPEQARRVLSINADVAELARQQAIGVRYQLGA